VENHSFIKFVPSVYVIYLSVPKVASSSISYGMMMRQPSADSSLSEHSPTGKALTNYRSADSIHPKLPIFTFTRHPIQKFLSYYKNKFVEARGRGFELDHLKLLKFDPDMSLEEVVKHRMTIPVEKMEHHAQPQYRILLRNGSLIPDFVGQVENISKDWRYIQALSLSEFSVLEKKNSSGRAEEPEKVDDSVLAALTEYYTYDFDLFGYEKLDIKVKTIDVIQPKKVLLDDQLRGLRQELVSRREKMIKLVTALEDPEFEIEYELSMKREFNDFLIRANRASASIPLGSEGLFGKFKSKVNWIL
jgi:hypothetical protein